MISFLITGMYWVWHRDLFTQVRHVNRDVVWLNLLFLLPAARLGGGCYYGYLMRRPNCCGNRGERRIASADCSRVCRSWCTCWPWRWLLLLLRRRR